MGRLIMLIILGLAVALWLNASEHKRWTAIVRAICVLRLCDTLSTTRTARFALATPQLRTSPCGSVSSRLAPGSMPSTAR